MLGLQVPHNGHVLLEATPRDDLLSLRDRATVLLLDRREERRRSLRRPWRCLFGHVDVLLSLAPALMRRAGRTDLIARAIDRCYESHGRASSQIPPSEWARSEKQQQVG